MAKKDKKANIGELDPGSADWQNAFYALSPQDQAAIFNQNNAPAFNYDFDQGVTAAYAPDPLGWGQIAGRDPQGLGQIPQGPPSGLAGGAPQFAGIEMDPMYQQLVQSGGGVNIPSYTSAGKLENYDIGQEAARVNLMQDNATSMADIIQAAMAGPGAIDPQSFAPVVTKPTERIATPGLDRIRRYAGGTGAKAWIARKMLPASEGGEGASDDEAVADLFNFLDAPDDPTVSQESKDLKKEIIDSMGSAFKGSQLQIPSGRGGSASPAAGRASQDTRDLFDESAVAKDAREMYDAMTEDQSKIDVGWEDPSKPGTYYTEAPTEEDSPAMQKFRNLGLPSPFAAYNDPDYLNMAYQTMAPNLQADMERTQQGMIDTQAEQARIGKEVQGPINRNIETQRLLRQNPAGFGPPPRTAGPLGPAPAQPGYDIGSFAAGGGPPLGPGVPAGKPTRPFSMGAAPSTFQPAGRGIGGVVNPGGGFDFGGGRPAEQQALGNAALNAIAGLGLGGGPKRGTKTAMLNADTAKQSQAAADEARKRYAAANVRSYLAMNATTPDMAMAAQALARANNQASMGNTPFLDVARQRKTGQRAQGVRA